ncbi:MAG: MBL fold metallo-hydrolase [Anaerolineales bacterium]
MREFRTQSGKRIFALPLEAFPNLWAYVYLIDLGSERILIDAGSSLPTSIQGLEAGLQEAGYRLQDLTHVLLTHGHIDHFGGIGHIRAQSGAQIGVHELDWQTVSRHEGRLVLLSRRLETFLNQAGVEAEKRREMLRMYRMTKALYRSVEVDFTYEAQGMQLGPLQMLHVPGHCPGHVLMRLEDVLFSGDLLLNGTTPHQAPESIIPFMGIEHYLQSLQKMRPWVQQARLVLGGHHAPLEDAAATLERTRQRLGRRLAQVLEAFCEPRTIWEVTHLLYGEKEGYDGLLVVEKMGAYVEYLYQRGWLEIVDGKEGEEAPLKYRCVRPGSESEVLPEERNYVFV